MGMIHFYKEQVELAVKLVDIKSKYDAILIDLNSDLYGILASVLLKHGRISCIKEFIKSVD